jgi:uncharacterized repeat protein (TIGR03943 family)
MRRDTTNVLLVLVGAALVKITLDGTYLRYVRPTVRPLVLAAGIVLVVLAAVAIVRDAAAPGTDEQHHHHPGARLAWLLALPVLTIFLVAPPALGADTVLRAGNRTAPAIDRPDTTLPPLPSGAVVPDALSDFVTRSVWDSSRTLTGRTVALTGFVVHAGGADYVARLVITCCAADATPMKAELTGRLAAGLPDDQWIQVTGRLRPGSATTANGYTPTLAVIGLHTVAAPADPYEH